METCLNCRVELNDENICENSLCEVKDHCKDHCPNKESEAVDEVV